MAGTALSLRDAGARDIAILALVSLLFASAFIAIKVAIEALSPVAVAAARTGLGALFTAAFVGRHRAGRLALVKGLTAPGVALVGLLGYAVPFTLVAWAERSIDAGLTGLLISTGPIFGLVLAPLFVADERITARRVAGVVVGGGAVAMALLSTRSTAGDVVPAVAVVAAAGCYAVAGFTARRLGHGSDVIASGALAWAAGALMVTAAIGREIIIGPVDAQVVLATLYLGAIPTALCYILRFRQIAQLGYGFVSFTGYLVPVFSIALGNIIFGESLNFFVIAALCLVLGALAIGRRRGY